MQRRQRKDDRREDRKNTRRDSQAMTSRYLRDVRDVRTGSGSSNSSGRPSGPRPDKALNPNPRSKGPPGRASHSSHGHGRASPRSRQRRSRSKSPRHARSGGSPRTNRPGSSKPVAEYITTTNTGVRQIPYQTHPANHSGGPVIVPPLITPPRAVVTVQATRGPPQPIPVQRPELKTEDIVMKNRSGCRLFIGNLPSGMDEEGLKKLVGECAGSEAVIEEVYLNTTRNFAFISLDTREHASDVRRSLEGKTVNGKRLSARRATHKAAVWVGDLNPCVTNERLYRAFQKFGEVDRAIVVCDDHGNSKGHGFVEFARKTSAMTAIHQCNEGLFLLTKNGPPVRVKHLERTDEEDGLPEKSAITHPDYALETAIPPHFAVQGQMEYNHAMEWRDLAIKEEKEKEEFKGKYRELKQVLLKKQREFIKQQEILRKKDEERRRREFEEQQRALREQELRAQEQMRMDQQNQQGIPVHQRIVVQPGLGAVAQPMLQPTTVVNGMGYVTTTTQGQTIGPIGQQLVQSVGQPVRQPIGQSVGQSVGQPVGQPIGASVGQHGQSVSSSVGKPGQLRQPQGQPRGPPWSQLRGQPHGQPQGQPGTVGQPVGTHIGQQQVVQTQVIGPPGQQRYIVQRPDLFQVNPGHAIQPVIQQVKNGVVQQPMYQPGRAIVSVGPNQMQRPVIQQIHVNSSGFPSQQTAGPHPGAAQFTTTSGNPVAGYPHPSQRAPPQGGHLPPQGGIPPQGGQPPVRGYNPAPQRHEGGPPDKRRRTDRSPPRWVSRRY